MEMIIENRIRLKDVPESLKDFIIDNLVMPNPKYTEAQSAGRYIRNIPKYLTNFKVMSDNSFIVPRGTRSWIVKHCEEHNIIINITDKRTKFDHITIDSSKIQYKPYQFDGVLKLISAASEGVLVSPAGSGKTVMGLSMIPLLGQPTLWLTHTNPLVAQVIERVATFIPDIGKVGLIGNGKFELGKILTVGLVQTLFKNISGLVKIKNNFGLVIVDEAHRVPSRTFTDAICSLNPYYLYALTATPYRRDKLENLMFQTIGVSTVEITKNEVGKYGGIMLPEVRYREIRSETVDNNDIQTILNKHVVENDKRNNIIVEDVLNEAKAGHFCIVISDRRDHCEILVNKIKKYWPKTGIATGKYSKKYVQEQVNAFNDNTITVLVATCSLLGEGFDVPFLDRAFITMPFRAEAKTEQLVGRIQRTHECKRDAVVLDYVDVDIGVLKNQFFSKTSGRLRVYKRLGLIITQRGIV